MHAAYSEIWRIMAGCLQAVIQSLQRYGFGATMHYACELCICIHKSEVNCAHPSSHCVYQGSTNTGGASSQSSSYSIAPQGKKRCLEAILAVDEGILKWMRFYSKVMALLGSIAKRNS